jgi:hypothetical protein
MKFPPLYECSVCSKPVKVTTREGEEPVLAFACDHHDAIVWANRKVTLYGVGNLNAAQRGVVKIKVTVRQFLSWLTGRSI